MKQAVVVDTNVPVVANGGHEKASPDCVLECIRRIRQITTGNELLVLDDEDRIFGEYRANLHQPGQPDVGYQFFLWVHDSAWNDARCRQVHITLRMTPRGESFEEFPSDSDLAEFDPRDHKFVAVALVYEQTTSQKARILNAVDRDWWDFRTALEGNGVVVDFLCPDDIRRAYPRS